MNAHEPSSGKKSRLWYRQPAAEWTDALPLGNGRIGAMVFGGIPLERIQLNEESLWSGGPRECDNPAARPHLQRMRELLLAGRPIEAAEGTQENMMGTPNRLRPYQTLGDLWIHLPAHAYVTDYARQLDLCSALATTTYHVDGVRHSREAFISTPDDVLVLAFDADWPASLFFEVRLGRPVHAVTTAVKHRLLLQGRADGDQGVLFAAGAELRIDGGRVRRGPDGQSLAVSGADRAVLLLAAFTDYRHADPVARVAECLQQAGRRTLAELRERHVADYRSFFDRVDLTLPEDPALTPLPTDQRLARVAAGGTDTGLAERLFHYGRYLLISSSRPGCLPANLQGIWADGLTPPWNSDYHLNINIQMNYWPAEVTNLADCHDPFFDLLDSLRPPGRKTAAVHYGCRGFVAHHITDIWGFTSPGDRYTCGLWPMGAAWMATHLWEHYRFTQDLDFLATRGYPIMREAAEFFLDFLIDDGHGHLVTAPSSSPENRYRLPDGRVAHLCVAASMDMQILRELFGACIRAAARLGQDAAFAERLAAAMAAFPPQGIGRHGQLMEWMEDYEEPEPGHRHISHLFALHPGSQIDPETTPELAAAARRSLERRLAHGGGHTGWSRAWLVNFWARLRDGEQAWDHIQLLMRRCILRNLFDTHPPFQIDGNFGVCAGIAEMLLQSDEETVRLLPALPAAWHSGEVAGLCSRGNRTVDMTWREGRLTAATIRCRSGGRCRPVLPSGQSAEMMVNGRHVSPGAGGVATQPGDVITLAAGAT